MAIRARQLVIKLVADGGVTLEQIHVGRIAEPGRIRDQVVLREVAHALRARA